MSVQVSVSPLHMANMPPRFSLMATDLTEQKRIATLADSERLAQALLATAQ